MGSALSYLRKPEEEHEEPKSWVRRTFTPIDWIYTSWWIGPTHERETERRLVNSPFPYCNSLSANPFTAPHLSQRSGGGVLENLEDDSDSEDEVWDGRKPELRCLLPGIEGGRPWFGVDSIQKRMHPKFEALGPNPSPEARRAAIKEVSEEPYCELWSNPLYKPLPRGKRAKWYTGIRDRTLREPRWTDETNALVQNVDPHDEAWWKQDAQLKFDIISQWLNTGGAPDAFPRFSNIFNSRQQHNGVEMSLSRMFVGMDVLREQIEDRRRSANAAVRQGRMSRAEANQPVELARANLRDAEEELLEVLEFA